MDLMNPVHVTWMVDLVTVFLMGILHGITPDEHTWPITFSYSIGSYSTRGGLRSGLLFSLAFTVQRAIASELAYFALAGFLLNPNEENLIYILAGIVMVISGYFILFKRRVFHLLPWIEHLAPGRPDPSQAISPKLPLLHGFIAGWGTGAFATIIYTVISPHMPSPWIAFLPGLIYGLGTTVMQMLMGAGFGRWMEKRNLTEAAKSWVGRLVAGRTLLVGGSLFLLVGIASYVYPAFFSWEVPTGIPVYNLDSLNAGLLMVILAVGGGGVITLWRALKRIRTDEQSDLPLTP